VRFSSFGILSHIVGRDSRRVIIVHLLKKAEARRMPGLSFFENFRKSP
jgi:hypothetical protein